MHSFRLRYVVLGLLVYLQNAFCQSCGPKFDDISSKAYTADIVIQGKVLDGMHTHSKLTFPATISVEKVYKGQTLLKKRRRRFRDVRLLSLYLDDTADNCTALVNVTCLTLNSTCLFFMYSSQSESQRQKGIRLYNISALPESDSKKNARSVRKIVDDTDRTVKFPEAKVKPRKKKLDGDDLLRLKCSGRGFPSPFLHWFKDGVLFDQELDRRFRVRTRRRSKKVSSTLIIKRVRASDSGIYKCEIVNVVGSANDSSEVNVQVNFSLCPKAQAAYCQHNGTCYISDTGDQYCKCEPGFTGKRCQEKNPSSSGNRRVWHGSSVSIWIGVGVVGLICFLIILFFIIRCLKRQNYEENKKGAVPTANSTDPYSHLAAPTSQQTKLFVNGSEQDVVDSMELVNETKRMHRGSADDVNTPLLESRRAVMVQSDAGRMESNPVQPPPYQKSSEQPPLSTPEPAKQPSFPLEHEEQMSMLDKQKEALLKLQSLENFLQENCDSSFLSNSDTEARLKGSSSSAGTGKAQASSENLALAETENIDMHSRPWPVRASSDEDNVHESTSFNNDHSPTLQPHTLPYITIEEFEDSPESII